MSGKWLAAFFKFIKKSTAEELAESFLCRILEIAYNGEDSFIIDYTPFGDLIKIQTEITAPVFDWTKKSLACKSFAVLRYKLSNWKVFLCNFKTDMNRFKLELEMVGEGNFNYSWKSRNKE